MLIYQLAFKGDTCIKMQSDSSNKWTSHFMSMSNSRKGKDIVTRVGVYEDEVTPKQEVPIKGKALREDRQSKKNKRTKRAKPPPSNKRVRPVKKATKPSVPTANKRRRIKRD